MYISKWINFDFIIIIVEGYTLCQYPTKDNKYF